MSKINYIIPILLWLFSGSASLSAQVSPEPVLQEPTPRSSETSTSKPAGGQFGKSSQPIIWSEDFSNGIPANWRQNGSVSAAQWEYRGPNTTPDNNTGSRGNFAGTADPINSSSQSNGFVIFDSDYLDNNGSSPIGSGSAPTPHVGRLITDTIDLSWHPNVELTFQSYLRRFQARFLVTFSRDGGATFPDTVEIFPENVIAVNSSSDNGVLSYIDASDYIGGESQAAIQFIFDGTPFNTSGAGFYFWQLDDIELRKSPRNQLLFTSHQNSPAIDILYDQNAAFTKYGTMHRDQIVPISFDGNIRNVGSSTQTNVRLEVDIIDDSTQTVVTTLRSNGCDSLAPGEVCSFQNLLTNAWTPILKNTSYTCRYKALSDSLMTVNDRNTETVTQYISSSAYSLDRKEESNFVGTSSATPQVLALGSRFNLTNEASDSAGSNSVFVDGLYLSFSPSSDSTGTIEIAIHDTAGFSLPAGFSNPATLYRNTYSLSGASPGNKEFFSFANAAGEPLELPTGQYFVNITLFQSMGGDIILANDASFDQPGFSSIMQLADGSWFTGFTNSNLEGPFIELKMADLSGCEDQNGLHISSCSGPVPAPSGTFTISQSGSYTDTLLNSAGCDSILHIQAEISQPVSHTRNITTCSNALSSPSGNAVYRQSGTYTDTLKTAAGCDSILTINLTLNRPRWDTITLDQCHSYQSPAGNTYNQSGVYFDTLQTAAGCDSVLAIDLTITQSINTNIIRSAVDSLKAQARNVNYQWYDCSGGNFTPISGATNRALYLSDSGYYAVVVSDANCTDTSECREVMDVNIKERDFKKRISLFPNPTRGKFKLVFDQAQAQTTVKLYAADGRQIWQRQLSAHKAEEELSLGDAPGIYLLEVQNIHGEIARFRVVKQSR